MRTPKKYRPYRKGYLKVSDGHLLYYEVCGNPRGVPILFLHGGPGAGFTDESKRRFDMQRHSLILFDQRGAGRSRPFGSLKGNTTFKSAADIHRLLDLLKIKKVCLYGYSWGSTLAMVYAIRHPERVFGMLIGGIFLGTQASIDHYISGGATRYFPEAWERFVGQVPPKHRRHIVAYYLKKMRSPNRPIRRKFAYEWSYYELSICKLALTDADKEKIMRLYNYESLGLLEAHYMNHRCFLPNNYILKNVHRLAGIPVSIVNGRYDMICPPADAYRLHQKIKGSRLHIRHGGHFSREPDIAKSIARQLKQMTQLLKPHAGASSSKQFP